MFKRERIFTWESATSDISAGLVVAAVALPLCLGASVASQAPLVSGFISAAIAGIIVTWLSGSILTVSAPAIGLAVMVMSSIQTLGSFPAVLVAILIAGLLQILFGIFRTGALASFVPHSVIRGMLAAVGFIMILKQIPHALGWDVNFEGDESFGADLVGAQGNTFTDIYQAIVGFNPTSLLISLTSLGAFLLWQSPRIRETRHLSKIPAAVVLILAGTAVHELIEVAAPQLMLSAADGHLLSMPASGVSSFLSQIPRPDWSALNQTATWQSALMIALFASTESLLTVEAADKFDPTHIPSDTNRELIAQGVGNILCGLCGGLPIAAGIIRSTANIYAGAKTRLAPFVQAILLLIAVVGIPHLVSQIPLAAFATLIIIVAAQLVRPAFLKNIYSEGPEQFLPFVITVAAIAFTDLLTGVGIGLVVGWAIVIRMNHHSALTVVNDGGDYLVRFAKDVTFAHKLTLKKILLEIPENSSITIDGTGAHFIDHDILDVVRDFRQAAPSRKITVYIKNCRSKRMSIRGVMDGKLQEPFAGE